MPTLYVIATPIGNLSDLSPRALETLHHVSLVTAEDTRVTGALLHKFGIEKPLISCHRHNESGRLQEILGRMAREGIDVALTTDAGTPAISDPGNLLVKEAAAAGMDVVAIPGCCAVAAALSVSGFSAGAFAFYGFLPRERGSLRKKLDDISRGIPVCVVYESPHRVTALVQTLAEKYPDCSVCCCCDLTKLFEKVIRGSAKEVAAHLADDPKTEKGEYCLVFDFSTQAMPQEQPEPAQEQSLMLRLVALMLDGATAQQAIAKLSEQGVRKNDLKRAALALKKWITATAEAGQ